MFQIAKRFSFSASHWIGGLPADHPCGRLHGHGRTISEELARWLYDWCFSRWPEVAAVRISKTPKTWAEYRPG